MDKNDKDIRKEIEELEKLIEQVKQQNEDEKRKQKKNANPKGTVVLKINLGMEYTHNLLVNLLISFAINFLVIFVLFNIINFAYVSSVIYLVFTALILTLYEELYRKYLIRNYVSLIIFSSGLIYLLMNLILFYFLDLIIFGGNIDFNNHWYPIVFVIFFHIFRIIIRTFYLYIIRQIALRKLKKRR
ncbi:MAG: hypothetical protein WC152_00660 [Candidatus Izemoplasmatales bacterium]